MFAKYYVELPAPFEAAKRALLEEPPEAWLPGIVQAGGEWEGRLLAEVGFLLGGRRLGRRGRVSVGRAVQLGQGVALPLRWRAAERDGLFPAVEADLELAPLGPSLTQLSVSARYEPPLAAVGRIADRALLHRVAEAVIRDFTERVGERLRLRIADRVA